MALVAPLLRLEHNHCHVEESEHVLKKAHKYSELIILYEKKGLHEKGEFCGFIAVISNLMLQSAIGETEITHFFHFLCSSCSSC